MRPDENVVCSKPLRKQNFAFLFHLIILIFCLFLRKFIIAINDRVKFSWFFFAFGNYTQECPVDAGTLGHKNFRRKDFFLGEKTTSKNLAIDGSLPFVDNFDNTQQIVIWLLH